MGSGEWGQVEGLAGGRESNPEGGELRRLVGEGQFRSLRDSPKLRFVSILSPPSAAPGTSQVFRDPQKPLPSQGLAGKLGSILAAPGKAVPAVCDSVPSLHKRHPQDGGLRATVHGGGGGGAAQVPQERPWAPAKRGRRTGYPRTLTL